jgi:hypothetical protein
LTAAQTRLYANAPTFFCGRNTIPFQQRKNMTKLRDEYTAKMHIELDALNAKMNALEASAHEVQADVREQYHRELAKLHQQSLLASAKLESIKKSGEDTWDKMVLDMNNVRNALLKSFDYFKSQL